MSHTNHPHGWAGPTVVRIADPPEVGVRGSAQTR